MEPVDAIQHLAERLPRHSRLSELEHQPPDVAHQPYPDLHVLDLDIVQRPLLDERLAWYTIGVQVICECFVSAYRSPIAPAGARDACYSEGQSYAQGA